MELRLEDDPASLREHTCYGSCTSDPHQLELQLEDDPSLSEQIKCYGINTAKHQLELPKQTCYESTTEHMHEMNPLEDLANNFKKLTCYGSAHESFRSEVVQPGVDPSHLETVNEDELLFQWLMQPKPQELEIGEEIGKGGQAHVSLGKYYSGQNINPDLEVDKRYKTGHGIDAVQLKRRMAAVKRNSPFGLCSMHDGVLEDKTKGQIPCQGHPFSN
jgi:hypothetical protein